MTEHAPSGRKPPDSPRIRYRTLSGATCMLAILLCGWLIAATLLRLPPWLENLSLAGEVLLLGLALFSFWTHRRLLDRLAASLKAVRARLSERNYDAESLPDGQVWFLEEKVLSQAIHKHFDEQAFLETIKQVAGRGYVIEDVLENLFRHLAPRMPIDRIDIAYVNRHRGTIVTDHVVTGSVTLFNEPPREDALDSIRFGECLKAGLPVILDDLDMLAAPRMKDESLHVLVQTGIRSVMMFPLLLSGSVFAFLTFGSSQPDRFGAEEQQLGRNIAMELSSLLDKTLLTKTIFSRITHTFSELVDRKDVETGDHITRMVTYSTWIAERLLTHPDGNYRLDRRFVRDITNNAAIHDIGKVAVPDAILKKPGKLDADEWKIMKTHSIVGADILRELKEELLIFRQDFYEVAENIARHHHERWDGTGYPSGLRGHDIPIEARIVAVADVFDALSSRRSYKPAWEMDACFDEMRRIRGSHLDPVLVDLFLELQPQLAAWLAQPDGSDSIHPRDAADSSVR